MYECHQIAQNKTQVGDGVEKLASKSQSGSNLELMTFDRDALGLALEVGLQWITWKGAVESSCLNFWFRSKTGNFTNTTNLQCLEQLCCIHV